VHVFANGRIAASGGAELADQLENEGYEAYTKGGASA
jgi:Fe-S cluster assembly ATP-binding protein